MVLAPRPYPPVAYMATDLCLKKVQTRILARVVLPNTSEYKSSIPKYQRRPPAQHTH
jgi:hypothetical protein